MVIRSLVQSGGRTSDCEFFSRHAILTQHCNAPRVFRTAGPESRQRGLRTYTAPFGITTRSWQRRSPLPFFSRTSQCMLPSPSILARLPFNNKKKLVSTSDHRDVYTAFPGSPNPGSKPPRLTSWFSKGRSDRGASPNRVVQHSCLWISNPRLHCGKLSLTLGMAMEGEALFIMTTSAIGTYVDASISESGRKKGMGRCQCLQVRRKGRGCEPFRFG